MSRDREIKTRRAVIHPLSEGIYRAGYYISCEGVTQSIFQVEGPREQVREQLQDFINRRGYGPTIEEPIERVE